MIMWNRLAPTIRTITLSYLSIHLIHYYPEIPEVGLEGVIKEKPYELIETLQSLSRIRIFEGKCPICEKLVAD